MLSAMGVELRVLCGTVSRREPVREVCGVHAAVRKYASRARLRAPCAPATTRAADAGGAVRFFWFIFGALTVLGAAGMGCGLLNGATKMGSATAAASQTTTHTQATEPGVRADTNVKLYLPGNPTPVAEIGMTAEPVAPAVTTTDRETKTASAASAPVETPDAGAAKELHSEAPKPSIRPEGPAVSGGETSWTKKAEAGLLAEGILYAIGALALIAGGFLAVGLKQFAMGGSIAGGGALVLIIGYGLSAYPWLIFVVLGLGVAAAVAFVWHSWNVQKLAAADAAKGAALGVIVPAVEKAAPASEPAPTTLKGTIAAEAKSQGVQDIVTEVVRQVKAATKSEG